MGMEKLVDCAVISADRTFAARAARLMGDKQRGMNLAAQYTTPIAQISRVQAQEIRDSNAQIVLLDLGDDPAVGLRLARFLTEDNPTRTFVVAGPTAEPEVLLEAMRVGASEYLPRPVEDADLAAALARATRRLLGTDVREAAQQGRLIAVYGAKGGVGVTTAAANIAVMLARHGRNSTLLVDLDLDMGNTAVVLGLRPRYSIMDVMRNLHRIDRDLLASYVEHHESGVSVLASPVSVSPAEPFTHEQTRSMLQLLRRQYEHVVIDLDRSLNALTMAALETADTTLVVTTPDVASLNNTKRALPLIDRAAGDARQVRVVVNRHRATDVITLADVAKALGRDVFGSLAADDAAVCESLNTGKPVVHRRKSRYGRSIRQLTQQLGESPAKNGRPIAGKREVRVGLFTRRLRDART